MGSATQATNGSSFHLESMLLREISFLWFLPKRVGLSKVPIRHVLSIATIAPAAVVATTTSSPDGKLGSPAL